MNQELEQCLRLYIIHHQDDWVDWISMAEFAHNNRVHSATGFSPFYVNMGYHPNCGTNISTHTGSMNAYLKCKYACFLFCIFEHISVLIKHSLFENTK